MSYIINVQARVAEERMLKNSRIIVRSESEPIQDVCDCRPEFFNEAHICRCTIKQSSRTQERIEKCTTRMSKSPDVSCCSTTSACLSNRMSHGLTALQDIAGMLEALARLEGLVVKKYQY